LEIIMENITNLKSAGSQTIAILGLGAMGERMAARLVAAGYPVRVWNRTAKLVPQGAQWADSPRIAATGADFVIAMVYDDAASRSVWLHPTTGALAGLSTEAIAVECSTLSVDWVSELSAAFTARKLAFIDAPVAGSRPQAQAGQLIFMAGGEAAHVTRAESVLRAMGSAVHHVGPVGSGSVLKLAVNSLFAVQVAAVTELLQFLRHNRLDVPRAFAALQAMPVLSPAASGAGQLTLNEQFSPMAPIDLIVKDLQYATKAAQRVDVALPTVAQTLERYQLAARRGYGQLNINAVAKLAA
jgi:3-hydroxyisobutyrate dehydrogenase